MWDWTENQMTLILIRHGKTRANEEQRYLGQEDEPLSAMGRDELCQRKKRKTYPQVDCVFTSPMKRCRQTAGLLYPELSAEVIEQWREIDFGLFSGKNHQELQDNHDYLSWLDSNGTLPFPKGESREEFLVRCEAGFEEMIRRVEQIGIEKKTALTRIGLVVHGGVIMALLSRFGGGDFFDYQIKNGEYYSVQLKKRGKRMRFEELVKG